MWDVFGQAGHPVRATVEGMGSLLLSRLLDLNETQSGILAIVFKVAQEKDWPLIDLKDLQSLLKEVYEHSSDYSAQYGNITKQSVGAIQRSLLVLEEEGADQFFGEPALDLNDFMQLDASGRGYINILSATKLFHSPKLYSTFFDLDAVSSFLKHFQRLGILKSQNWSSSLMKRISSLRMQASSFLRRSSKWYA